MISDQLITQNKRTPIYNIGSVARMTGISVAALRVWERRYSFPESGRTPSGHRLYSEIDIKNLQWVKSHIDEGLHVSQAIQILKHQETEKQNFIELSVEAGKIVRGAEISNAVEYISKLSSTLISSDFGQADQIISDALAIYSPEQLILNIIRPTMAKIGDLWIMGQINIATEHMVTKYLHQRLMQWISSSPPPAAIPPVILACVPDEWHDGSLLILGSLLKRRLIPVIYLGQAVPLSDLFCFAQDVQASWIILVAMTSLSAEKLVNLQTWFPESAKLGNSLIGFGGHIFVEQPDWIDQIPAVYLGDTFESAVETIIQKIKD